MPVQASVTPALAEMVQPVHRAMLGTTAAPVLLDGQGRTAMSSLTNAL